MIDLAQTFEKAGLFPGPWRNTDTCRWCWNSHPPPATLEARGPSWREMAHIFNAIFAALQQRDTRYASVLGALLELRAKKPNR